jgi:hypothetical protein
VARTCFAAGFGGAPAVTEGDFVILLLLGSLGDRQSRRRTEHAQAQGQEAVQQKVDGFSHSRHVSMFLFW